MTDDRGAFTYAQKWKAIGKHMQSHGMENVDLGERLGGLHKDTVRKARSGKKPFSEERMEQIPAVFGVKDYHELVAQAEAMPDMSPQRVADSIYRFAENTGKTLNQVTQEAGFTSKIFTQPHIGITSAYQIATKGFGLDSIAQMVSEAENLPAVARRELRLSAKASVNDEASENIGDKLLAFATKCRQKEKGYTDTYMAKKLGLSRSQYMTTIKNGAFQSAQEREMLPEILGFNSVKELVGDIKLPQRPRWPWAEKNETATQSPPPASSIPEDHPQSANNDHTTGHWQHLMEQSTLSGKFGKSGGSL